MVTPNEVFQAISRGKNGAETKQLFRVFQCTLSSKPVRLTDPANHLTELIYSVDFIFQDYYRPFRLKKADMGAFVGDVEFN